MKLVNGIYSKERGTIFWTSFELFCKKGEVRLIDGELHALEDTCFFERFWFPVEMYPTLIQLHSVIDKRCVLKDDKKKGDVK